MPDRVLIVSVLKSGAVLVALGQPRDHLVLEAAVVEQRLVEQARAVLVVRVGRERVPQLVVDVLAVLARPHQDELTVARHLCRLAGWCGGWLGRARSAWLRPRPLAPRRRRWSAWRRRRAPSLRCAAGAVVGAAGGADGAHAAARAAVPPRPITRRNNLRLTDEITAGSCIVDAPCMLGAMDGATTVQTLARARIQPDANAATLLSGQRSGAWLWRWRVGTRPLRCQTERYRGCRRHAARPMDLIWQASRGRLGLLARRDPELYRSPACPCSSQASRPPAPRLLGIPLGIALHLGRFAAGARRPSPSRPGMGFPPVVIGLLVTLLLWRTGPLGPLALLYTPAAMMLAQLIVALPLIAGFTYAAISLLDPDLTLAMRADGAGDPRIGRELAFAALPAAADRRCRRLRSSHQRSRRQPDGRRQHRRPDAHPDHRDRPREQQRRLRPGPRARPHPAAARPGHQRPARRCRPAPAA